MADEKKFDGFSLQSTGVITVALAVIGLIWAGPNQLIDERPVSHMKSDSDIGQIQDVDARMWQDPLEAVDADTKDASKGSKDHLHDETDHAPEKTIRKAYSDSSKPNRIASDTRKILLLGVMIPGGPYPEEEEERRRKRYAVLSALATLDYQPEETEHIGYFTTHKTIAQEKVPFELFEKKAHSLRDRIAVLWIDDSKFITRGSKGRAAGNIDESINRILGLAQGSMLPADSFTKMVIGPNKSGDLAELTKELVESIVTSKGNKDYERQLVDLRKPVYFSAGATISPGELETFDKSQPYNPFSRLFRTTSTDDQVSKALIAELAKRQVKPNNENVLLITEWDTLYGRTFPKTFASAYNQPDGCQSAPVAQSGQTSGNVYCVNYMRGIDGYLPGDPHSRDDANNSAGKDDASKHNETIQINNNIDRPSGNYQQDYLRRLVEQIRTLDRDLKKNELVCPFKNNGIAAIGVVGSDVYDKLMILQALRASFPGKIFFTTDMDAAYLSEQEKQFTHNLIIGSSFGLTLAPSIQSSIPPFRDSYQSAVFLSAKLATSVWETLPETPSTTLPPKTISALSSKLNAWLATPRIFEVGRKNVVDLSPAASQPQQTDTMICPGSMANCDSIFPETEKQATAASSPQRIFLLGLTFIVGLLLLYRLNWTTRYKADDLRRKILGIIGATTDATATPRRNNLVSALILLACASLIAIILSLMLASPINEEPVSFINGISTWPSNLLQLVALLMSLISLYLLAKKIGEIENELSEQFALHPPETNSKSPCSGILSVHQWTPEYTGNRKLDLSKIWLHYLSFSANHCRLVRTFVGAALLVSFGALLIMLTGSLPVPSRGNLNFYIDAMLETICAATAIFLVVWIVDTVRLASRLINIISKDNISQWPNEHDEKWGWERTYEKYIPYWLDVEFVARYTKQIENFIWFPIPPLLLLGAARSSIFDNWTFSAGLIAMAIILLVYLFSTAFILQYSAKSMRTKAQGHLENELRILKAKNMRDEKMISGLETMIAEIKNNDEGAFTPFLHQPPVQALIALLSGSGGVMVLLERFL